MYLLNESVTVLHSLFLKKSMLMYLVFRSVHVMKYLYPPIDCLKGPQTSDMITSPMLVGRSSVFWNGSQVCFPYGQSWHWVIGPCCDLGVKPVAEFSLFMVSRVE